MTLSSEECYAILGLEPGCTLQDIKARRRILNSKYHPDRNPNDPEAEDLAKNVNQAAAELERLLVPSTLTSKIQEPISPRQTMGNIAQRLAAKVKAERSTPPQGSTPWPRSSAATTNFHNIHDPITQPEKSMFQKRLAASPSIRENAGTNTGGRIIIPHINAAYQEVYLTLDDRFVNAAKQYLINVQGPHASMIYGEVLNLDSDLVICSSILDEVYLKKCSSSPQERRQKIVLPLIKSGLVEQGHGNIEDLIRMFGTTIALIPHPKQNPISSEYEHTFWTIYNHIGTNISNTEQKHTRYLHQLTNLAGTIIRISTDPKIRKESTTFYPEQHALLASTLEAIIPCSTNIHTCTKLFSSLSDVITNAYFPHWKHIHIEKARKAVDFLTHQKNVLATQVPPIEQDKSISEDEKWQILCEAVEFIGDSDLGLSKNYYRTWEAAIIKLSNFYFSPDLDILIPLILTLSDASHKYEDVRYPSNLEEAITALTTLLPLYRSNEHIIEQAANGLSALKKDARGNKNVYYNVTARVARAVEYISYCIGQCNQYPPLENRLPELTEILSGFAKSRYYHEPHQSQKAREKIDPPLDQTTKSIYERLEQVQTKPHDKRTLTSDDIHYILDTFAAKFKE